MRRGYQKGSLKIHRENWVAQWWQDGHRRNRVLGPVSKMTKSKARAELAAIVAAVNNNTSALSGDCKFQYFMKQVFLPFYRRKWKLSTTMTNEDRFKNHLISELGNRVLSSMTRDELQNLLDRKAARSVSMILRQLLGEFSVAIHHSGSLGPGGLIQTLPGEPGGCGGLRTKRSGVIWKA